MRVTGHHGHHLHTGTTRRWSTPHAQTAQVRPRGPLACWGSSTLAPSSALADGTNDTVTSGGASGCCKIIN